MKISKILNIKQIISIFCLGLLILFNIRIYAQEEDEEEIQHRAEWFIHYRTFPNTTFPINGYSNAFQQKHNLENNYNNPISLSWEKMGPEPETGGNNVYTGKVNFLKYDPTEQNVVYIGAAEGGLWKSINSGSTWTCITEQNDYNTSGDLAIDPTTTPHTLYYGTGELMYDCWLYYGNGIYISHDEGATWTHIGTEGGLPEYTYFYKIAIDPANNQHLLAAIRTQNMAQTGLYKSLDGGITWSIIIANIQLTDCAFAPSGSRVYAVGFKSSTTSGFLISYDNGQTFTDPGFKVCDWRTRLTVCEGNPSLGNYLYILTSHPDGYDTSVSLYKSTNGGTNFTFLPRNDMGWDYWSQYCLYIKVSPVNPDLLFICKTQLWKSVNGGVTFNSLNYLHADHHCIDFDPYNIQNTVMWGCDGGVAKSNDLGTTYNGCNTNLSIKQMYRINSSPYNPEIILGGAQDNGVWRKDNANSLQWSGYSNGDYSTTKFSKVSPNHVLAAPTWGGHELYSSDAGSSWEYTNRTDLTSSVFGGVTPITSDPINPITFYTARNGILKTTNDGYNWIQIGQNLPSGSIDAFNINSKNPAYMYAVANQIWDPISFNFYKTTDGGNNWNDMQINISGINKVPFRPIMSITSDPANPDEIVIGLSGFSDASNPGTVFRSQDGGINWFSISGNLPPNPVNSFIIYYSDCNTKNYVAATDIGVFTSSDGSNWSIMGQPHTLPSAPCVDLDFNRLYQKLFVSLYGRCAYRLDLGGGSSCINPIIVKDNLVIGGDANINYDIIVCPGGTLSIPYACNLQFASGKGITIMDGGQIVTGTNLGPPTFVNLTSQSNTWAGITFKAGGYGNITNTIFQNAPSAINIDFSDWTGETYPNRLINIKGCTFNNGTVYVNNEYSMPAYLTDCTFNVSDPNLTSAIQVNMSDAPLIMSNTINNSPIGITLSNFGGKVVSNSISYSGGYGNSGISLDNCYTPWINGNTVSNYSTGYYLLNSSPLMLHNYFNSNNSQSDNALYVSYGSYPRLTPTSSGGGTIIWDAGYNIFNASSSGGNGIDIEGGYPDIALGINFITAGNAYLTGYTAPPGGVYYCDNNCWDNGSTNASKFQISNAVSYYIPDNCTPPFAYVDENSLPMSGGYADIPENELDPPQPIIIDLGNGYYDTIQTKSGNLNFTPNEQLYSTGINEELSNNYINAISTYKQIVSSYQDSITAVKAIIRLLSCTDKIAGDTSKYTQLHDYYTGIIQNSVSGSMIAKVAAELANKTFIRIQMYPTAITGYESMIQNTSDSLRILCYQLNIIETYMLIQQNGRGNSLQFTGNYKELKPATKQDGFRMITELLHHIKSVKKNIVIPKEFKLSQNYPNPFNPTTKIDYQLPKSAKVVIKVYDILGKLVRELVNENKETGFYTVTFDGTNFASGVYFYRINAGDFNAVKKMVLVK